MNQKKWTPGRVVWRELIVPDIAKAKGYYGELFGWKFEGMGPDDHYTVLKLSDKGIGGLMRPPMPSIPPCWMSYISVEDVDAVVQKTTANGGKVIMPPSEEGGVGRFAVIADPTGAVINVIRFNDGDPANDTRPPVGAFCWETLLAGDEAKAKAFYAAVFGWKVQPGPGGHGSIFATKEGAMVADLQTTPKGVPPHWATYVAVENLDTAKQRTEKLGGKILVQRIDVPEVGHIAVTQDPQGATICLFQSL